MLIKKSLFLSLLLTSAFMSQSLTGRGAISEYSTVNKECLNIKILNSQDLAIKGTHVIVRVKGFNISDEKILSSVIWVAELLDNYLDSFTQTFNISLRRPVNLTILSPALARNYNFPKTRHPVISHFMYVGSSSLIAWWDKFTSQEYLLLFTWMVLDAVNMYCLFLEYITGYPWLNKLYIGLLKA